MDDKDLQKQKFILEQNNKLKKLFIIFNIFFVIFFSYLCGSIVLKFASSNELKLLLILFYYSTLFCLFLGVYCYILYFQTKHYLKILEDKQPF